MHAWDISHLYITVNHIVVVAVSKSLQNLPHVMAAMTDVINHINNVTSSGFINIQNILTYLQLLGCLLPGHCFTVHKASIGSFNNFKTQVCTIHAD